MKILKIIFLSFYLVNSAYAMHELKYILDNPGHVTYLHMLPAELRHDLKRMYILDSAINRQVLCSEMRECMTDREIKDPKFNNFLIEFMEEKKMGVCGDLVRSLATSGAIEWYRNEKRKKHPQAEVLIDTITNASDDELTVTISSLFEDHAFLIEPKQEKTIGITLRDLMDADINIKFQKREQQTDEFYTYIMQEHNNMRWVFARKGIMPFGRGGNVDILDEDQIAREKIIYRVKFEAQNGPLVGVSFEIERNSLY